MFIFCYCESQYDANTILFSYIIKLHGLNVSSFLMLTAGNIINCLSLNEQVCSTPHRRLQSGEVRQCSNVEQPKKIKKKNSQYIFSSAKLRKCSHLVCRCTSRFCRNPAVGCEITRRCVSEPWGAQNRARRGDQTVFYRAHIFKSNFFSMFVLVSFVKCYDFFFLREPKREIQIL